MTFTQHHLSSGELAGMMWGRSGGSPLCVVHKAETTQSPTEPPVPHCISCSHESAGWRPYLNDSQCFRKKSRSIIYKSLVSGRSLVYQIWNKVFFFDVMEKKVILHISINDVLLFHTLNHFLYWLNNHWAEFWQKLIKTLSMLWWFRGAQSFPSRWELFFLLCSERSVTTGFWRKENKPWYFSSHSNCVSAHMTVCSLNPVFSTFDPFIQLQQKVCFQTIQRLTSIFIGDWRTSKSVNGIHASALLNLNHLRLLGKTGWLHSDKKVIQSQLQNS